MTRSMPLVSLAASDEELADHVIDAIWQVQQVSEYGIASQLQIGKVLGWPIGSKKDQATTRRKLGHVMPLVAERAPALHPGLIFSMNDGVYQLISADSTEIGAVMAEIPRIKSASTKYKRAMHSMPTGLPVGREIARWLKVAVALEEALEGATGEAETQFAAQLVDVG